MAAAAAAPTVFSAALEKWIFDQTKESIFLIEIKPRLNHKAKLVDLMKKANTVKEEERVLALDKMGNCVTGFMVDATETHYKILTSAHIIGHVFTSDQPISVADANRYFRTDVLCDHSETSFCRPGRKRKSRVYAQASILGICCTRDLMLIGVPVKDLNVVCNNNHPPLACSMIPPQELDECVMVSWPPLKHRSTAKGRISHPSRAMGESGVLNPAGYNMSVMQVQIESEYGSSGAPLLNAKGNVIGILHGGFGRSFSYFVTLNEIELFLTEKGVDIRHG